MDDNERKITGETTKFLIEQAEKDLTRLLGPVSSDQRSRLIFYQSFSVAMISAHIVAWNIFGVSNVTDVMLSSVSCGLFCVILFLSVFFLSGGNYKPTALKNISAHGAWGLDQEKRGDLASFYKSILKNYNDAVESVVPVVAKRGKVLRALNALTLFGMVVSAFSLTTLIN